jgi:hypothetical protein
MNELLSNIYLVYLQGPNAATAESDSFFSFIILMSQTQDKYTILVTNTVSSGASITQLVSTTRCTG